MNYQFQTQRLYLKKRSPMILSKSIYTDTKFKMSQWKPYDPPYSNYAFQMKPSDLQIQTIQNYQSTFSFSKILLQKAKEIFKKIQFNDIFQKFKQLKDKFWDNQNIDKKQKLDYSSDSGKIINVQNPDQDKDDSSQKEKEILVPQNLQKRKIFPSVQIQNQKKIQKLNSGISLFLDEQIFESISDDDDVEVKQTEIKQKNNDRKNLKIKRKTLKYEEYVNKGRIIKPLIDEFKKPKRKEKTSYGDVKKIFEQNGIKEAYKNETDDDFDEFSILISQKSNIQPVYQSDTQSFISDLRKLNQQSQKNQLKIPKQTKSCTYSLYTQNSRKSSEVANDNQDSISLEAHSDCQYSQSNINQEKIQKLFDSQSQLMQEKDYDMQKKDKFSSLDQDSQLETDNEHEQYQKSRQKTIQQSPKIEKEQQNINEKQEQLIPSEIKKPEIIATQQLKNENETKTNNQDEQKDTQKPLIDNNNNPFLVQKQNNTNTLFQNFINSAQTSSLFQNVTTQAQSIEQKPLFSNTSFLNINNANNDLFQSGQKLQQPLSSGLFGKPSQIEQPNFLNNQFFNNQQKIDIDINKPYDNSKTNIQNSLIPQINNNQSLFSNIQNNNNNFNLNQQQNISNNQFQIPLQQQSLFQPTMFTQSPNFLQSEQKNVNSLFGNSNTFISASNDNPFIVQNKQFENPIPQTSGFLFDNSQTSLRNDSQQQRNNKKKVKQRIQG